jgi:hypothetical protein
LIVFKLSVGISAMKSYGKTPFNLSTYLTGNKLTRSVPQWLPERNKNVHVDFRQIYFSTWSSAATQRFHVSKVSIKKQKNKS